MVEKNTDEQRLRLLLPFYLNNTLAPDERAEIDAWLAANASARQELRFMQAVAEAVRQPGRERAPMHGYEQLAARRATSRPAQESWWRRLLAGQWAPVSTMAALLLAVQLGWNYSHLPEPGGAAVYRGVAHAASAADLKLVVRRDARFADLAELLAQHRCHVVWGPSVSGELWVVLDDAAAAEATRQQLARSPLIEDAMLLPRP